MKRLPLAALLAAFFIFLALSVSIRQAVLMLVGVGMGAALAAARFGFTTGWRQLIEQRNPQGVTGQVLLLALASLAALPLLGQFSELHAALGPPSVSLLVGAFVFGLTMQIADGCGSGSLYKAGLGVPLNMGILPLFALGSFLGSVHLDSWLSLGQTAPVSFYAEYGTGGALALTLALLAAVLVAVRLWVGAGQSWFDKRWVWGAVALAVLATLNLLLAGQPWGVVYGFGLWAAKISVALGTFEPATNAFWGQAGNAQRLTQTVFMDVTTITNIGILGGALWVSAKAPAASKPLTTQQWVIGLVAGFIMGYSSRLAFGCNIGAMLSGISTGSLHGWLWVPLAFAGTLIGVRVRRHYQF
ncbi:YeeE/YedE thiosulfate transporter family protein [Limnohabitans sp. 2KL-3]|uniref:YeeE/YedE thiosulfate transporter family protein n=1 Tax=Limnohabitans sp. 2KL-3 TaxID=1100700 RepID=UPI000B10E748|nr:YeeE/YedE thiosulfate transporter family protein [Limnohabitans sp. 2KL-3]